MKHLPHIYIQVSSHLYIAEDEEMQFFHFSGNPTIQYFLNMHTAVKMQIKSKYM